MKILKKCTILIKKPQKWQPSCFYDIMGHVT